MIRTHHSSVSSDRVSNEATSTPTRRLLLGPFSSSAFALLLLLAGSAQLSAQSPNDSAGAVKEELPEQVKLAYDESSVQKALEHAQTYSAIHFPADNPPDGQWFESTPGKFYVSRLDKGRAQFRKLDDETVRLALGWEVPLIEETPTDLFVLIPKFETTSSATPASKPETVGNSTLTDAANRTPTINVPPGDESLIEELRLRITTEKFDRGLPVGGQWRNDLALADLNGDGFLDILHGPARKSLPRINAFLGNGEGNWTNVRVRFNSRRLDYGDIAVADLNQDGHLDVALAMHLLGTTVAYGSGVLTFEERDAGFDRPDWARPNSTFGKRASWSSRALEIVDIDQDGDLDFLAVGEGAESLSLMRTEDSNVRRFSEGLTLYLNNGEEAWTPVRFKNVPAGGDRIASGNFDADPEQEVVVAWAKSRGINFLGDFDFSDPQAPTMEMLRPESIDPNHFTFIKAVAAGDVFKGGTDEIVVGQTIKTGLDTWQTRIELHARPGGDPSAEWKAYTLAYWLSSELVSDIEVGDIDGDGHNDIVASTDGSRVVVLRNSGKGTFYLADHSIEPLAYNCAAFSLALGNIDGKKGDEIISGFAGETVNIPGLKVLDGCDQGGRISAWRIREMELVESTSGSGASLPAGEFQLELQGEETPQERLMRESRSRRSGQ